MTYDIKCKYCKRFLAKANSNTIIELKCSNSKCKKMAVYSIVFATAIKESQLKGKA